SGGDAVIDDDGSSILDVERRAARAVDGAAALDLFELTRRLFLDIILGHTQLFCQRRVDEGLRPSAVADRAERQFGLPRNADLAHENDIERRIERPGDLEPDRDAAARQGQHDRAPVFKMRQSARKLAAGIGAVGELHGGPRRDASGPATRVPDPPSSAPGPPRRWGAPRTTQSPLAPMPDPPVTGRKATDPRPH